MVESVEKATASYSGKLGVPNLLAMAEIIEGASIAWNDVPVRETLEHLLGLPYQQLFDRGFGSPLFDHPEERRLRQQQNEIWGERHDDDRIMDGENPLIERRRLAFKRSFGSHPLFTDTTTDGVGDRGVSVGVSPSNLLWGSQQVAINGIRWCDPIQGALADCYLFVVLIALAWQNDPVLNQTCSFPITGRTRPSPVVTDGTVPLLKVNGYPAYGHSSDFGEGWPALWEVAYAVSGQQPGDSSRPDMLSLNYGWPNVALAQITAKNVQTIQPAILWATLDNVCDAQTGKVNNPFVTWTWPMDVATPVGVSYTTINLCRAHAYALLGRMVDAQKNGYIVLRNPIGVRDMQDAQLQTAFQLLQADAFWGPLFLQDQGMIAVPVSLFALYFQAAAWC